MTDSPTLGPGPVAAVPAANGDPRRPRRRWLRRVLITIVIAVPLLIALLVGADIAFRGYAQGQIEKSVQSSLPTGVQGTVHARILGFSSLWQYLHGHFDHVHIVTQSLSLLGQAAFVTVEAYGVPVSGNGAVTSATGTLHVSQAAVRKLAPLAGADAGEPSIGEGTISTTLVRKVLGFPITVHVTLKPSIVGKYVQLTPTKAELSSGALSIPGTTIIKTLLPDGIAVCTAKYLPPTMELTSITAHPSVIQLTFVAQKLNLATLGQGTGHCD